MSRGLASEYKPRKATKFTKNIEDILDPIILEKKEKVKINAHANFYDLRSMQKSQDPGTKYLDVDHSRMSQFNTSFQDSVGLEHMIKINETSRSVLPSGRENTLLQSSADKFDKEKATIKNYNLKTFYSGKMVPFFK